MKCQCGNMATCFGEYEGIKAYGCDICCGHGCEDGHCEFIDKETQAERDIDGAWQDNLGESPDY